MNCEKPRILLFKRTKCKKSENHLRLRRSFQDPSNDLKSEITILIWSCNCSNFSPYVNSSNSKPKISYSESTRSTAILPHPLRPAGVKQQFIIPSKMVIIITDYRIYTHPLVLKHTNNINNYSNYNCLIRNGFFNDFTYQNLIS